jgi:ubiquitin C-terminal hydrolase
MDIYRKYGWIVFNGELRRLTDPKISYKNIDADIYSFNPEKIKERFKLYLLLNTLCQNIFNYGDIHLVNHANFISYLEYAKIPPKLIELVKYRLSITKSVKRDKMLKYMENDIPKNYSGLIKKTNTLPQMQYIQPVYNEQFIKGFTRVKNTPFKIRVVKSPLKLYENGWYMIFYQGMEEMNDFSIISSFPILKFLKKNCIITNCLKISENSSVFLANFLYIVNVSKIDNYLPYFYMAQILGAKTINIHMNGLPVSIMKKQVEAAENVGISLKYYKTEHKIKPISKKEKTLKKLVPIPNKANSCYMDTVLFSLLYREKMPRIIREKLFTVSLDNDKCIGQLETLREYLVNLRKFIFGKITENYCINFRRLISSCGDSGKRFSSVNEQDVGEFLIFLFDIFQIKGSVTEYIVYGIFPSGKSVEKTSETIDNSLINFTDSFYLSTINDIPISKLLNKKTITEDISFSSDETGNFYIGKIERVNVLKTLGFYVFYIQRAHSGFEKETVLENIIVPDKEIIIGKETLYLYSIIFHIGEVGGGHYLCCFLHDNQWYLYDDMKSYFSLIGDYEKLIEYKPIKKRGILFFYTR